MSVPQQVADPMCSYNLTHEAKEEPLMVNVEVYWRPREKCHMTVMLDRKQLTTENETKVSLGGNTTEVMWDEMKQGVQRCSFSQWGIHAGLRTPADTASSQTPLPGKCPQGSARLCEEDTAASRASSPTNTQWWRCRDYLKHSVDKMYNSCSTQVTFIRFSLVCCWLENISTSWCWLSDLLPCVLCVLTS